MVAQAKTKVYEEIFTSQDPDVVKGALKKSFSVEMWLHWAKIVGTEEAFERVFELARLNLGKAHLAIHEWVQRYPSKQLFEKMLQVPHFEFEKTQSLAKEHGFTDLQISAAAKKTVQAREFYETRLLTPSKTFYQEYIHWERDRLFKIGLFRRALEEFPSSELWLDFIEYLWQHHTAEEALEMAQIAPLTDGVAAVRTLLGDTQAFSGCDNALSKLCVALDDLMQEKLTFKEFFKTVTWAIKQSAEPKWMLRVLTLAQMVDREEAEQLWVTDSPEQYEHYSTWLRTVDTDYFKRVIDQRVSKAAGRPLLEEKLWVFAMCGRRLEMQLTRGQIRRLNVSQAVATPDHGRSRETNSIVTCGNPSEILAVLGSITPRDSTSTQNRTILELGSETEKEKALALLKYRGFNAVDATNTVVWLTNYPQDCNLKDLASQFGQVLAIRTPQTSGRRFAYIQYSTASEAINAIEKIQPPLLARLSDPKKRQDRSGAVEESRQIHISGFDFGAAPEKIEIWLQRNSLFAPDSIVVPSSDSRANPGYAFVVYASSAMAEQCLEHFSTLEFAGRSIRASLSRKKRRQPNKHTLSVSNVDDPVALQALVEGDVKYDAETQTALLLFSSEQDVFRASLALAGTTVGGQTLRVEQPFKPRKKKTTLN